MIEVEVSDGIAVVTLNRPERRNALNSELTIAVRDTIPEVDARDDVSVIILTGADPAFCAGLDLKELGAGQRRVDRDALAPGEPRRPWPRTTKPVIGAINGVAITGGFELALQCDFLVASERAAFADTHSRVGILPGWGLTVLLAQAVGVRKAKELSMTGNFLTAAEALQFGLVNHVVAHDELLPFTRKLATDIISNDQGAARRMLAEYDEVTRTTVAEGLEIEARISAEWARSGGGAEVEQRRQAIIDRGRSQV